jgi:hypothetical protein
MKLNKAKKERIEAYLDMLEFNCDIRSCYSEADLLKTIDRLYVIKDVSKSYLLSDKPMLQLLEQRYHKDKIVWS